MQVPQEIKKEIEMTCYNLVMGAQVHMRFVLRERCEENGALLKNDVLKFVIRENCCTREQRVCIAPLWRKSKHNM